MKGQLITSALLSLCLSSCSGFQEVNVAKKGQCVHDADNVRGKDGGEKMEIGCWRCNEEGQINLQRSSSKKKKRRKRAETVHSSRHTTE
ncbi:hypothetical protein BDV38DRAFT_263714 [Aspergillus pseudotamarii]|uniref:Secreted protein n=1 Tax=Aspergillus pseudotamarii TaxID=132259 RepID=A0A5N6SE15_ASPPS|nr:uncharacterized protein BDV38DRAFT_263714 [Aspergillus pseudotamarii]KAE8131653.1 hypothetical protein BDV38DRAFT_263714 [Aspergillus pseudotamarii]